MANAIRTYWQATLALVAFLALMGMAGASDLRAIDARCGWTMENEMRIAASCASESELRERMDAIRNERSGFRTWEDGR